MKNEQHPIF